MKLTKKLTSVVLAGAMAFSLAAPAMAENNKPLTLDEIATEYISVTYEQNEVVYSNLQEFYAAVHKEIPDISDLELSKYMMDFTDQSYDGLSDEAILEELDFLEVRTSNQIFGQKQMAVWKN